MDVDLRGLVERTSAGMLSLDENSTLQEIVNRQTDAPAVLIGVFGVMAALALVLATMGISASVNQSAVRRRRSFAIRLALGAGPTSLAALAVGRDALLAAVGAGAGALITLAVTKTVWPDALFVAGTDWRFWLGACSALVGSAMLASIGPAWRTLRLDPMSILGRADT
jgi:ABC-type antimicrobial peptide transport system permease subunit